MSYLRLNADADVSCIDNQGIVVRFNGGEQVFDEVIYDCLIRQIGPGRHEDDLADAVQAMKPGLDYADIYFSIEILKKHGVLERQDDNLRRIHGVSTSLSNNALLRAKLTLTNLSGSDRHERSLRPLLAGIGGTEGPAADMEILLIGNYADSAWDPHVRRVNRDGTVVLPIGLSGAGLIMGPVFDGAEDARCPACLRENLSAGLRFLKTPVADAREHRIAPRYDDLVYQASLNIFACEIARHLAAAPDHPDGGLRAHIVGYDARNAAITRNFVDTVARCDTCVAQATATREPAPQDGADADPYVENGLYGISPESTYRRIRKYVNPVCGIVKRLDEVFEEPGVHSVLAGQNLGFQYRSLRDYRKSSRNLSGGKGRSAIQAKVSAICETLERFCGVHRGNEPAVHGCYDDLADDAIDPRRLTLYSETQLEARQTLRHTATFDYVPARFDPGARLSWTPVTSLATGADRLLPTAMCYFGFSDGPALVANSNGCAAGNTVDEAILSGLMEVVERDCVAIWWYNGLRRPAVDLAALGDEYYDRLTAFYKGIDREFWVLDLTHDLGIPCFASVSRARSGKDRLIFGFGVHMQAPIAISRAVTEMNQFLPKALQFDEQAARSGLPAAKRRPSYQDQWLASATLQNNPHLGPSETTPSKPPALSPERRSVQEEIRLCVDIMARNDLTPYYLDQSRPGIDLSVVKTFVPGMRHFWKCFDAGRLYDVPVKKGWLADPTPEDKLNPVPMFL
ncbi:TOMM precursor leader peptide-binding protein [Roseovarius ramblicola]|uniref:TOMM leader peptide-binding protein n=1 Tax=Roseovarius ramblicola TaxID=2022336 RepID=A0ABV5I4L1_9RHOB